MTNATTVNTPPEPPKQPKPSVVVSSSKAERIFLIISCICIIGGAVLFIYGEQAVGIGQEGVVNKFLGSLGMAVASIGMFIVGCFFVKRIVLGLKSMSASERSETRKAFVRQLSIAALNVLVYGALFILLLGSLTALDGASAGTDFVVFAVWAACIASFVLYRRHRKKHKVSYELLKQPAITVFLFLFAVVILAVFIRSDVPDSFQDLIEGLKQPRCFWLKLISIIHLLVIVRSCKISMYLHSVPLTKSALCSLCQKKILQRLK